MIYSLRFVLVQLIGLSMAMVAVGLAIFWWHRKIKGVLRRRALVLSVMFIVGLGVFSFGPYLFMTKAEYPFIPTTFGPAEGPALPLKNLLSFFGKAPDMEKPADIARDPNDVPPPDTRTASDRVKIELEAKEVIGKLADGVEYNYWTFDGTVPGPMLRVREGDTVELTLKNNNSSVHGHNIDLHAVTGPGGGAAVTNVEPGESKTFTFKALNPGLYVYHCAHPNVGAHMAHGMYGMILVEPKAGLPKVDKEFYVMQGELYTTGRLGKQGLQIFDAQKMLDGKPEYIVFNGRVNGTVDNMRVKAGDRVRIYVGNGGVNLVSSFHVVGEIFDEVYPEGSMGSGAVTSKNVQTTVVPVGGATVVDFTADVPGKYVLVDHALSRLDRGAWGTIEVTGDKNATIFSGSADAHDHGGH
jgi:nitrite reductase (NO-forming)